MVYSLSYLKTWAQCDFVLDLAAEKRKTLVFRDTESDFRTDNTSKTATNLSNELTGLNTYITAMTPVIPTMVGKERTEAEDELRKKTDRRDELVSRQGKAGGEKLVERELGQALLEPQLPVIDDFIAQVTAHRATLSA